MANVSVVSICNIALGNIGVDPITSSEFQAKSSTVAGLCDRLYEPLRDAVIEAHDWTFAIKRTRLPKLANSDSWGWSAQFKKPNDCLRLLYVTDHAVESPDGQIPWVLEDDKILANANALYIKYLRKVQDPNKFTAAFVQALAARMSMDLAMPLTNSASMMQTMAALYEAKKDEAKIIDGLQGRKRHQVTSSLVAARVGMP